MSNLMAIDLGNTRTKWGVHDGRVWIEQGVIENTQLEGMRKIVENNKNFNKINKLYISNVADKNTFFTLKQQLEFTQAEIKIIQASAQQCRVINHYDKPEQLGSDRWCALIAARHLHKGPAVVVMMGTAMTIDALTAEGHFLGGMIVPGFSLMQESLRNRTAQLRPEIGEYKPFPTHTQDAVHSGIISASLGAITQMCHAMRLAGNQNTTCILSGGAIAWIAPHISEPKIQTDNLVLEGILQIAKSESAEHK
jgi:type III pantothenate kinase